MKSIVRVFTFLYIVAITPFLTCDSSFASAEKAVQMRVARLSYIEGPVSILRTQDEDWIDGMINTPLMAGDQVYTGPGGKAEIQLEDNVNLYLAQETFLAIKVLDDALGRIEIMKGILAISAQDVPYDRPPLEIQSAYFKTTVLEQVKARVHVSEAGPAEIPVRRGILRVYRDEESHFRIKGGEKLLVENPDPNTYLYVPFQEITDFDRWCDLRDAIHYTSPSKQYVSNRVAGYQDLDRYGEWIEVPTYGRVWRPTTVVVNEWAPYRSGRWVYVEPYSWTWVSYEPWGWVPYHYGRWVYTPSYRWCWVPHEVVHVSYHHRPVWYPALVSFTYARHGKYFNFSIGGSYYSDPCIGWFPLGPHDPYHRWYHHRGIYVDPITHVRIHDYDHDTVVNNITINNTTINNYQNSNAPNGVTVMPRRDFIEGRQARRGTATLVKADTKDVHLGKAAITSLPQRREKREVERRKEITLPGSNTGKANLSNTGGGKTRVSTEPTRNNTAVSRKRIENPDTPNQAKTAESVNRENRRIPATKARRSDSRTTTGQPSYQDITKNRTQTKARRSDTQTDARSKVEESKTRVTPRRENTSTAGKPYYNPTRINAGNSAKVEKRTGTTERTIPRLESNTSRSRRSVPSTTSPSLSGKRNSYYQNHRTQPSRSSIPKLHTERKSSISPSRSTIPQNQNRRSTITPSTSRSKSTIPSTPSRSSSIRRNSTPSTERSSSYSQPARSSSNRKSSSVIPRSPSRDSSSTSRIPSYSSSRNTYTPPQSQSRNQIRYSGPSSSTSQNLRNRRGTVTLKKSPSSSYSRSRSSSRQSFSNTPSRSYQQPSYNLRSPSRSSSRSYSSRSSSPSYSSPQRSYSIPSRSSSSYKAPSRSSSSYRSSSPSRSSSGMSSSRSYSSSRSTSSSRSSVSAPRTSSSSSRSSSSSASRSSTTSRRRN